MALEAWDRITPQGEPTGSYTKVSQRPKESYAGFHFPALEKEMATHSSVLARRIPGMAEPGGLQSMGSHRVGSDAAAVAAAAIKVMLVS